MEESQIWKILENYFREKGLVRHQIESYDDLIHNQLQRIVSQEPSISITPKKGKKYVVTFGQIYVCSPQIIDEKRVLRKITPAEARRRDLNYESTVFVDIVEEFITKNEDKEECEKKVNTRVALARIPTMIYSSICNLRNASKSDRIEANECEYNTGGYFVIKGKERVLIAQERINYNQIYVFPQKPISKYKYIAEIRSMSEETGHSVLVQCKIDNEGRNITFSLPYIKEDIPIGVVFKALGLLNFQELECILNLESLSKKYMGYITRDSCFIKDQESALKYMGQFAIHNINKEKKEPYAGQVVESELFPHMGIISTNKERIILLGHMVRKLIFTYIGKRAEDDRDNVSNKRVETAGILIGDLFRTLFKRVIKKLSIDLQKRQDVVLALSKNNSITMGILRCMCTGSWGVQKNAYVRNGVSQILSRLSYIATLANLRRLVIPIGKEGKNAKIRQIHPSQYGLVCPSESPEGTQIGIVKNFALLCCITNRIPTVRIKEIVESVKEFVPISEVESKELSTMVPIFLNGIPFGYTSDYESFVKEIRRLRDNQAIDKTVSVLYDKFDGEVRIYSDEGRMYRPFFTVKNRQLCIRSENGYVWDDLVNKNLIRYVDSNELEQSVIAMDSSYLLKKEYDYCEIHPSTMLGVCAATIPYANHSQAPRNIYASSMVKQGLGMYASSYQTRTDTITHVMDYPQKRIISTRISNFINLDKMTSGINAIVAIACFTGFNQEDSILINKGFVDRGGGYVTSYRTISEEEFKRDTYSFESILLPEKNVQKRGRNYSYLDHRGVVRTGIRVKKGDVIIGKVLIKTNKSGDEERTDCSIMIKPGEEGIVDRVYYLKNPNGYRLVKVVVRRHRRPEVGDKLASTEAQKGICGAILAQEDMPFDERTSISPDIVINSHCIPSRMTINQLMEMLHGKVCCIKGEYGDATPWTQKKIVERLTRELEGLGYEKHGWEKLRNGMTGTTIRSKIFVGVCYYQRLKHMVADKLHGRASGFVTMLTRQPLEGNLARQPATRIDNLYKWSHIRQRRKFKIEFVILFLSL